jgi:hypothetical protein
MLIGAELICGVNVGFEIVEDSDYHYLLIDLFIIRLQFCKEKPQV